MNRSLVILIAFVAFAIPVFGQSAQPQSQTAAEALYDRSSSIELLMAAEGGGGFTSGPQATAYAGVKLGGDVVGPPLIWSLDMGYDRLRGPQWILHRHHRAAAGIPLSGTAEGRSVLA